MNAIELNTGLFSLPQPANRLPFTTTPAAPPRLAERPAPTRWVDEHGDAMYRYALAKVQDPQAAQDLVQEAFLAALRVYDRFERRCSERTWLIGILKHKVADHFRSVSRRRTVNLADDGSGDLDALFHAEGGWVGHWKAEAAPQPWSMDPAHTFEREEFWLVLQQCLAELPPRLARVFWMREVEGATSDEICASMEITATNLWVMLHRARTQLRQRLEHAWFGADAEHVR
jgi:RNA polymerase sigma-70 factor (ECF subfamily)